MKKSTVERMYSAKVAQLLNDGWHINTGTMPGHQGEIAHVDLTDGSEIRRAVLYREMVWGRDAFDGHKICIVVGRNTDRVYPGWDCTIWNNRLEVLSQIELAEIQEPNHRHPEGWYTDMETAMDIQRLRIDVPRLAAKRLIVSSEDFFSPRSICPMKDADTPTASARFSCVRFSFVLSSRTMFPIAQ